MKIPLLMSLAAAAVLSLSACSEAERRDAGNDVEAAAKKAGAEVKDAARSPEIKELGAEIKEAAGDAGKVIKETAKGAADGARDGAAKVEAEKQGGVDEQR